MSFSLQLLYFSAPESPSGFFLESLPFIKFHVFNCWLRWAFAACSGCSPVVASGGSCPLWARGTHRSGRSSRRAQTLGVWVSVAAALGPRSFCTRALRLRLVGSREWTDSAAGAHELSCSTARGIFLGQGSDPCPLRWQADS